MDRDVSMFVEIFFNYSVLFTYLGGWYASAVSFPISDVILAQLACPLSDIMFCLLEELTYLSTNIALEQCLYSGRHHPNSQFVHMAKRLARYKHLTLHDLSASDEERNV